jgi:hypothetical protein
VPASKANAACATGVLKKVILVFLVGTTVVAERRGNEKARHRRLASVKVDVGTSAHDVAV